MSDQLFPVNRLWLGTHQARPQTQLFRRSFALPARPQAANLEIFAEAIYHLWINGQYVTRGPAQHHPHRRPIDRIDVGPLLTPGMNLIAVLVHAPGIALHNHVPSGEPGLSARLTIDGADGRRETIVTDAHWRATANTGWSTDVPRRNWALGCIEQVDALAAPLDWQTLSFDDSAWTAPDILPATRADDCAYVPRPVPPLRHRFVPLPAPYAVFAIDRAPRPHSAADNPTVGGKSIMDATWTPLELASCVQSEPDGLLVRHLEPGAGLVLCFDLGTERVGQIIFQATADSAGTIDIGWSETVADGRPQLVRKGVSYCDRLLARAGPNRWHPIGYSGLRYVALVLRGFNGAVRFGNLGLLESESALDWTTALETSERAANEVARLCERTIRVGTQEGPIDCPTREQATYIGDGHLICRWIAMLTGDSRYWASLVDDQFARPSPQGLFRTSIYSGCDDLLIDYDLLAIVGLRDYWRFTADTQRATRWLPSCRGILAHFDTLRDAGGLLDPRWEPTRNQRDWEQVYDRAFPDFTTGQQMNLFIDHPGMGWHNQHEAGIDRYGRNTALTALDVLARRALGDLEEMAGNAQQAAALRRDATRFAQAIAAQCRDASGDYFRDGVRDGVLSAQVSEQTNTLAVAIGCGDDESARTLLKNLLTDDSPAIARNGPYFWAYLLPELARLGLHELAMSKLALWRAMIDSGATTLWETFAGDDLDSWCHPWSAAPIEFLLVHIAGLPGLDAPAQAPVLRPRPDLLADCRARIYTRAGRFEISWRRQGTRLLFEGQVPPGVRGTLLLPDGGQLPVAGSWQHATSASQAR